MMNLLIDTQVFIWADAERGKLSPAAKTALQDKSNRVCLSVASIR
jgi:PIN domain nuclease of toxin-antitoxin system